MIDSLAASGGSPSAAAGTHLTTSRPPMPVSLDLGYRPFDIDNPYYEGKDAFTRHVEKAFAHDPTEIMRDKQRRLLRSGPA